MSGGDLGSISDVVRRVMACATLDHALQTATDGALELLPQADHASIRLCNDELELHAAARSGVGVDRGYNAGSLMSVPLLAERPVLGVLSVSAPTPGAFGDRDEAIVTLLASFAAQAVRVSDLKKLAITDAQTLVFNQRYLLPRLDEEMRRAERDGHPLSVMLMDLDHFKRVNDDHGHTVGDLVLRMFADAVRRCVRVIDIIVRRGGEEFVLIMPSTGPTEAIHVAERIRSIMEVTPLRPRADVRLQQTVSIGVATWDTVETAAQLDERADQAMYRAKKLGRNRVTAWDATTSRPPPRSDSPCIDGTAPRRTP